MPPPDFIRLVGGLGFRSVGLHRQQGQNPFGFDAWSLCTDHALRRETRAAMNEFSVSLGLGDGSIIQPGADVSELEPAIDAFIELGAAVMNVVSFETDPSRELEQLHKLAEMANAVGLPLGLECSRRRSIIEQQLLLRRVLPHRVGIVVDAMHFFRGGSRPADLASVDPSLLLHFQLCDVPLAGTMPYPEEAYHHRLPPGEGELPLADLIAALPADIPISMEIPQRALAQTGVSHAERIRQAERKCLDVIAAARAPRA